MPCDDTGPSRVNCGSPGPAGIGILSGYNSTAGYDLTTGLGSVNAANLVNKWSTITSALKPSTTTLSLNPTSSIVHGTPVTVQINVTPTAPATGTATGNVALLSTTTIDPGVTDFALSNGSVSTTTNVLPGGTYTVTAHYPGDGTFAASDSTPPVSVLVTPEGSKTAVSFITQDLRHLQGQRPGHQRNSGADVEQPGQCPAHESYVHIHSGNSSHHRRLQRRPQLQRQHLARRIFYDHPSRNRRSSPERWERDRDLWLSGLGFGRRNRSELRKSSDWYDHVFRWRDSIRNASDSSIQHKFKLRCPSHGIPYHQRVHAWQ
jgi:hypothetical protein